MSIPRLLLLILFAAGFGSAVSAADSPPTASPAKFDITPLITAGLLDPDAPLASRRELANRLIEAADRSKNPTLLYYVGTLYRQGDAAGIAPFPKDLDRAREYLSRAALGGSTAAMSKLAVVELDSGNRFEANLWAQLFVYYSADDHPVTPADPHAYRMPTGNESLASALLERANDGFPKSEIPRLSERIKAVVARYDPAIRRHQAELRSGRHRDPPPQLATRNPSYLTPLQIRKELGQKAASAVAEFFVEFAPDGKQIRAWPFDGWPQQKVLRVLRPIVLGFELKPAAAGKLDSRVVMIPVTYVNPTYRLKQQGSND